MKPTAKQIRRITYLANHHKKARVRKKNKKRLQKYVTQTLSISDIVAVFNRAFEGIAEVFIAVGRGIRQAMESINRCTQCNRILPVGRQICPDCEKGVNGND